jgi:hypothetical protein
MLAEYRENQCEWNTRKNNASGIPEKAMLAAGILGNASYGYREKEC